MPRREIKFYPGEYYHLYLSRYIHLNPVAAGLVQHPEQWEFSSYREYVGLRKGTLPCPEIVLSQFGTASDYKDFVQAFHDNDEITHLLFD